MSDPAHTRVLTEARRAPEVLGLLAVCGALAVLVNYKPIYALGLALVILGLGVYTASPFVVVAAAIPGTLLVSRIGGSTNDSNLSVSDLLLLVSTCAALPYMRLRESPALRKILGAMTIYEGTLLLTVALNPYRANVIEWVHEMFLFGGSLIVGFAVARHGHARRALATFVGGSLLIAAATCVVAVATHFRPVFLAGGLNKNFIGTMLMFAFLVVLANPDWVGWTGRWRVPAMILLLLGILGAQSRQAMIGCAVAVVVVSLCGGGSGRRSRIVILGLIPIAIGATLSIVSEFSSSNHLNSVYVRLSAYSQSLQVWHISPWLGVGLRWWYTARFPNSFQPPNAEFEMLTSAGMIGLAAFLYLQGRTLLELWLLPRRFAVLAFTAVLVRLVEGQFDIFWVTASSAIPLLLAGLALGEHSRSPTMRAVASSGFPPDEFRPESSTVSHFPRTYEISPLA